MAIKHEDMGSVDPLRFDIGSNARFVRFEKLGSCAVLGMPERSSHPALLSIR